MVVNPFNDTDIKNIMNNELREKFLTEIVKLPLKRRVKDSIFAFIMLYPLNDKKMDFFVNKLKSTDKKVGYIYRLVVTAAYHYGVPKIYIEKCLRTKKFYKTYKSDTESKKEMNRSYYELTIAATEMIKIKNTRKEKLLKIVDKISDSEN